jgi:hypothetical protein
VFPFAITANTEATLLGLAAIISAVGGIASVIAALRKNRSEEHVECLEKLKASREESERLAQELHELRMQRGEG